jgi:hypothetical protein
MSSDLPVRHFVENGDAGDRSKQYFGPWRARETKPPRSQRAEDSVLVCVTVATPLEYTVQPV